MVAGVRPETARVTHHGSQRVTLCRDPLTVTFAQVVTHVTRFSDMTKNRSVTHVTHFPSSTPIAYARIRVIRVNQNTGHMGHAEVRR